MTVRIGWRFTLLLITEWFAHCLFIRGDEQLTLCSSQKSSVTAFEFLRIHSYLGEEALYLPREDCLSCSVFFSSACPRFIFLQTQALRRSCNVRSHWGRLNIPQHLSFWFLLPINIFSAVWDIAYTGSFCRVLWKKVKWFVVFSFLLKDPLLCTLSELLQLAVFIYYAVWKPQKQWVTLDEGIWNSPLTYKPERREEAWRFISYMFVHAG